MRSSGPALSWRAGRPTTTLHFSSRTTRDIMKGRSDAPAERHRGYHSQVGSRFSFSTGSAIARAGVMPFPGSKTGRPSLSRKTLISRPGCEVRPETGRIASIVRSLTGFDSPPSLHRSDAFIGITSWFNDSRERPAHAESSEALRAVNQGVCR